MAVKFIDGFDHYSFSQITSKWTSYLNGSAGAIGPAYARTLGGQGLNLTANNNGWYKTVNAGGVTTLIIGCAVYFPTGLPANNVGIIGLCDATTEQVSVRGDSAGRLTVTRAGTVLATSSNTISSATWYYIELMATISATVGVIQLNVNGSSTGWVASTGGLNTKNTGTAQATGGFVNCDNISTYFDDLYIADTTGSVNNSILGPQVVEVLAPQSSGNYAQWTPNFGANFGNVRDNFPDGDQTFNESATAGQIDSFSFEDAFMSSGAVAAIQHVLYVKQDAGAQRSIAPFQRSSSTDYPGTTVNTATSYAYILECHDTNPDTGVAWTLTGLNAAEFGYKLIS